VSQFEILIASFAAAQNHGNHPRSSRRATDALDPLLLTHTCRDAPNANSQKSGLSAVGTAVSLPE
jgi:hypothetical protein